MKRKEGYCVWLFLWKDYTRCKAFTIAIGQPTPEITPGARHHCHWSTYTRDNTRCKEALVQFQFLLSGVLGFDLLSPPVDFPD